MFRVVLLALLPAVALSGSSNLPRNPDTGGFQQRDYYRVVAGSNLNFTNAIYAVLSRAEGNVFFSPLSIQVVMALATQGAGGKTQEEMIRGLHLPQDQEITREGFRQLLKVLRTNDGEAVKIANKIYTDRHYPPTQQFVGIAQQSFQSDGEKVDFRGQHDQARRRINKWVEDNTANKIQNLLAEGSIGRDTVMVLVNAVYFKGTWIVQFDPANTISKTFYVRPGQEGFVSMMQVTEGSKFNYKEAPELNAKILEMPYVGESMSFVIILPNEKFGLRAVESQLATTDMRELFKKMRNPEVHLTMPKFKLEQAIDLNDPLQRLGMDLMFTNQANFSGLASGPIKVSKVVHKSYIDVNEEGAEAAASTAVHSVLLSASTDEVEVVVFNVDHPFIFILRHTRTGSVLFMGRYARPTELAFDQRNFQGRNNY